MHSEWSGLFVPVFLATIPVMADPRTDQIAREAARLIETARADDLDQAIRMAADAINARGAPMPGHGRVRKHAQAMSMQALGESAYNEKRLHVWRVAEEVMSILDHGLPSATVLLVGRAVLGLIDAGITIHIRLYTDSNISAIAGILEGFGYEGLSFQTVDTRFGRLNQITFEDESLPVVITRCLTSMLPERDFDIFSGKPVESLGLSALRRQLTIHNVQE